MIYIKIYVKQMFKDYECLLIVRLLLSLKIGFITSVKLLKLLITLSMRINVT